MADFTPFSSALGGLLIGLSAALLLLSHGRIAGVSGIVGDAVFGRGDDKRWRLSFLGGLVGTGMLLAWLAPSAFAVSLSRSPLVFGLAGLLVGMGTRLGHGCTSGHGVCGISRFSSRSFVATLTFLAAGAATVYVFDHLLRSTP